MPIYRNYRHRDSCANGSRQECGDDPEPHIPGGGYSCLYRRRCWYVNSHRLHDRVAIINSILTADMAIAMILVWYLKREMSSFERYVLSFLNGHLFLFPFRRQHQFPGHAPHSVHHCNGTRNKAFSFLLFFFLSHPLDIVYSRWDAWLRQVSISHMQPKVNS